MPSLAHPGSAMIVLTGPTGNVGDELLGLFVKQADAPPYRVAAHHPERVRELHGVDVPVVAFDFDDRSTWPAVLDGITALFLLYPLPHPRTVKTRMTPFIDAAVAAGATHIVYVSVPGADHLKVVPHHGVERHIEASGASWTFLRSSYFMQNLVRAISSHGVDIMDSNEIFIPAGDGRTSFVDSRDVATVAYQALTEPGAHARQAYTLTGPTRLNFDEVAAILSEVLERKIVYTRPSLLAFWRRMRRRGRPRDVVFFMGIVYTLTRTGRNEPLTGELGPLLGRPPATLEQFALAYRDRWLTRSWT